MTIITPEAYAETFLDDGANAPLNPMVIRKDARIAQPTDGGSSVDHLKAHRLDAEQLPCSSLNRRKFEENRGSRDRAAQKRMNSKTAGVAASHLNVELPTNCMQFNVERHGGMP
jgi:hypothetical protein